MLSTRRDRGRNRSPRLGPDRPKTRKSTKHLHDKAWLDGYGIGGIAFGMYRIFVYIARQPRHATHPAHEFTTGIHTSTFFACVYFLLQRRACETERTWRRQACWLLAFVGALFAAGTVMHVALTRLTELAYVTGRNSPGVPMQWYT